MFTFLYNIGRFLFHNNENKMKKKVIFVYNDEGADEKAVNQTLRTLEKSLGINYDINTIKADEVISGQWTKRASLFVMPGGADLPYCEKLNGAGNMIIKSFVHNGGNYLGLCAGAYYASNYCEFDKGGPLEVLGPRELAFFPEKSVGPILAKYSYKDLSGARAALTDVYLEKHNEMILYYNGGGYFYNAEKCVGVSVIASYNSTENLAAIIHTKYGNGDVILSGLHFEYDPCLLKSTDPYLALIIPQLIEDNELRNVLLKYIFEKFHL